MKTKRNRVKDKKEIAYFSRWLADKCVRDNTIIEDIHAGKKLPEKYMEGYSRITEREMREFMLQVQENLISEFGEVYKLIQYGTARGYGRLVTREFMLEIIEKSMFGEFGVSWDIPQDAYDRLKKRALHKGGESK